MSNGFSSPYSDYQQASCQWLDSIPQHWIECRIKQIVSTPVTDGPHETPKFEDDGVPFLSAESVKDLKLDFARKRGFISRTLHEQYSRKYVPERGDIYMVKSGATTGALAIVETDEEFNIWSPLAAIRCRKDLCFDRFVFYAMQSEFFQRSVELSWSFGTQQNIGMGVIENLFIARPPVTEQKQIAAFLDYETAKIDALIAMQQQLIALLGEKRQAVISHAVTNGLNPDAPMRDSGVQWLGEVPEHWTTSRIGWLCPYLSYGFTNPMPTTDEGPHMLTAADISFEGVLYDTARRTSQSAFNDLSGKSKPLAGDVLVTKDGSLGRVTAYDGERPVCISQSVALLRPDTRVVDPKFLALALSGADYQSKMIFDAGGTTIKHIYISILAKMNFWFPGLDEKAKIVTAAAQRTDKMDELIDAATEAAELLRERRTALISAAVTGKIDVRGWKPPSSAAKSETEMEVA